LSGEVVSKDLVGNVEAQYTQPGKKTFYVHGPPGVGKAPVKANTWTREFYVGSSLTPASI
jgi:hypothetical protein